MTIVIFSALWRPDCSLDGFLMVLVNGVCDSPCRSLFIDLPILSLCLPISYIIELLQNIPESVYSLLPPHLYFSHLTLVLVLPECPSLPFSLGRRDQVLCAIYSSILGHFRNTWSHRFIISFPLYLMNTMLSSPFWSLRLIKLMIQVASKSIWRVPHLLATINN